MVAVALAVHGLRPTNGSLPQQFLLCGDGLLDCYIASEKNTALTFPRNFAPLPRSRRPYGTLNPSVPM